MQIVVNGVKKTLQVEGQPLTYAGVCVLAGKDPDQNPTVTWEAKAAWKDDFRRGAVMRLKAPHPGYDQNTLFLCLSVETDGMTARSHYGAKEMGPTLLWSDGRERFEVVSRNDSEPAIAAEAGSLLPGQLMYVRSGTVFNVAVTEVAR